MRDTDRRSGFTLLELIIVILILAALAMIGMPQYLKFSERGRLTEAESVLNSVRNAQERLLATKGHYVKANEDLGALDVNFPGPPPKLGMSHYILVLGTGAPKGCHPENPYYNIALIRVEDVARVIPKYFANYMMVYERCTGEITFPGCPNCARDFESSEAVKRARRPVQPVAAPKPPPPPPKLSRKELKKIRLALTDPEAAGRRAAVQALAAKAGGQPDKILKHHFRMEMDDALKAEVLEILIQRNKPGLDRFLIKALRDPVKSVRLAAVVGLQGMRAHKHASEVSKVLFDPDVDVRRAAMQTLKVFQAQKKEAKKKVKGPPVEARYMPIYEKALRHAGQPLPKKRSLPKRNRMK